MAFAQRSLEQHLNADGPKRILALDGGGLRGILTLGILESVERELRARHGNADDFRLSDYFDLIAGTSTGAIIAATLALGWSVEDIKNKYFALGERVFKRSLLRQGLFRAKYDEGRLIQELKAVYGEDTLLRSESLRTGLLVVVKRIDSGSPWPVSNNPRGKYFESRPGGTIGNGDYKLWAAVRASTAAPDYFDPERITIAQRPGYTPIYGDFVDGGVSPFNNPALQAFMYATVSGYNLGWRAGEENILLVSVGTGAGDPSVRHSQIAAAGAFQSLLSLMDDVASLQETMLQWMSRSVTARKIDSELQRLEGDLIGGAPQMTYLRYDADLREAALRDLLPDRAATLPFDNLTAMDAPENMQALHLVGRATGQTLVKSAHFPPAFDLPSGP